MQTVHVSASFARSASATAPAASAVASSSFSRFTALAEPCLFDADARFAACGDWAAGGGGATAAARSGEAAADRIATALGI
jgi:predicted NAD/FAD-dependent oxidoreductase